jgi:integrase
MFKDSFNDNVFFQTILDTRRSTKENLFPIRYRITYKRKQVYYKSGLYSSKEDWQLITSESKKKNIRFIREQINAGHDAIKEKINIVIKNNKSTFSFEKLNLLLKGSISDSLKTAFLAKINKTKKDADIGTSIYYQTALNNIIKYAGDAIKISEITVDWLNKYQAYLIENKRSYSTVGMYCIAIRTIYNASIEAGIVKESDYPFKRRRNENNKFKIPTSESRKMALTIIQIGELITTDVSKSESKYRDLWYFSYLCNGINIADLCRLENSDIKDGIICFYRNKSIKTRTKKKKIEAVILPQMQEIMDRWNVNNKTNYIFPFLTGKETPEDLKKTIQKVTYIINYHLKHIGKRIGINGITSYSARHSYATVLKRSGANISYISESLGHSTVETTSNYLDSFEKEEQVKNANYLVPKQPTEPLKKL